MDYRSPFPKERGLWGPERYKIDSHMEGLPNGRSPNRMNNHHSKSREDLDDMESIASYDSTGKKKSFRRLCERFAEKTSMQGIPYIHNAKLLWAKIIWTFLLLGAVGGMIFHLKFLFDEYLTFDKSTKIELGFDNLKFPDITVCNTNIIKRAKLNALKQDGDNSEKVDELIELVEDLKPENLAPGMYEDNTQTGSGTNQPNGGGTNTGNTNNGNANSGNPNNQNPPPTQGGQTNPPGQGGNSNPIPTQGQTDPQGQDSNTNPPPTQGGQTSPQSQGGTQPGGQSGAPTGQGGNVNTVSGNTQKPPASSDITTTRRPRQGGGTRTGRPGGQDAQPPRARRQTAQAPRKPPLHDFNASKYREDFNEYYESLDLDEDEFDSPLDAQAQAYDLFTSLFMDLKKKTRENIGHDISEMLISCNFNERVCDPEMFKLHQTSEYGNCWTLSNDRFISRNSGPSGGMELVLYLQIEEYLKGITNGYGIRLVIHRPNSYPFPYDEGFFISAAMETHVALKMKSINRIGSPHGECETGEEFQNVFNTEYSRQACHSSCRIFKLLETCGCFEDGTEEIAISRLSDAQPCRSKKEERCMVDLLRKFQKKEITCNCPNPCSEVVYIKSISQRQWPTDDYAKVLLDSACYLDEKACDTLKARDQRNLNYNFLKLNIYYEDLNFENVTEKPEIETVQFLSDVGGAIGLWIGLSLLSLCELGQLFIELINYCIHKTTQGKDRETRNRDKRRKQQRVKEFSPKLTDTDVPKGPLSSSVPNLIFEKDSGVGSGRNSPRIDRRFRDDGLRPSPRNSPRTSPHGSPWTNRRMRDDFGLHPPTRFYHEY